MGVSESLCEGVWINYGEHWTKQINVTAGTFSGFLMFSSEDGTVLASIIVSQTLNMMGYLAWISSKSFNVIEVPVFYCNTAVFIGLSTAAF